LIPRIRRSAGAAGASTAPEIRRYLTAALTTAGFDVLVSGTSAEALGQRRRLETAVVDHRLPDGSGIDVALRLRTRDPSIRILFITGNPDELRVRFPIELLGSESMEKPLDTDSVISWVGLALDNAIAPALG
jgi:DNA-binding response OmpR family regulator